MKTFFLFTLAAVTSAYGTTGHYGNQYAHKGIQDHSHQDHIYAYDSVEKDNYYKSGTGLTENGSRRDAIIAEVENANTKRIEYLDSVKQKRIQRLEEIHMQNNREIESPFEYQLRLLDKENDDITQALTSAITDANDAYSDLIERIDDLYTDTVAGLLEEIEQIKNAIDRAVVDQKPGCKVLHALKTEITKNIECDIDIANTAATYVPGNDEFAMYDGLFSNFHYDIGHGKGTGEGAIDDGRSKGYGPVGDYEVDVGKPTRYARY